VSTTTHPAEEAGVHEALQFAQAGQVELVLHDAVAYTVGVGRVGRVGERARVGQRLRGGLLGVHVLAGGHRAVQRVHPGRGDLGVEVDRAALVGQRRVEVGGEVGQAVALGERARSFASSRPTSTGSGQITRPSGSGRPPCSRIARMERTRCCR
jgi:hypothetical protein